MKTFKIIVEEEITALQRATYLVEGEDEGDAYACFNEGDYTCIDQELIDTYGPNGNSCDLIEIQEANAEELEKLEDD